MLRSFFQRMVLVASIGAGSAMYAQDDPRALVGRTAAALRFDKLLQAPLESSVSWEDLRGKVVVLEFWATWCAPCVAAMPHLNEVAQAVRDEPVRFIWITPESEEAVTRFLRKRSLTGWVALDGGDTVGKSSGVRSRPHTIVVNTKGVIAGVFSANDLSADLLRKLIRDESFQIVAEQSAPPPFVSGSTPEDDPPFLEFVVGRAKDASGAVSYGPDRVHSSGLEFQRALTLLYRLPSAERIISEAPLPTTPLSVRASIQDGDLRQLEEMFNHGFRVGFDLVIRREQREMGVLVATLPDGLGPDLSPADPSAVYGHFSEDGGIILATNYELPSLLSELEKRMRKPFIDETGLAGRYIWDLEYSNESPEGIIEAVRKQLGIHLTADRRTIEVLVVSRP